jgi:hypothetical protein
MIKLQIWSLLQSNLILPVVHLEEDSPANVEIAKSHLGVALPLVGQSVYLFRDCAEHASLKNRYLYCFTFFFRTCLRHNYTYTYHPFSQNHTEEYQ